MIPSMVGGKYVIRFCVTYEHATEEHIGEFANQHIYYALELHLGEVFKRFKC